MVLGWRVELGFGYEKRLGNVLTESSHIEGCACVLTKVNRAEQDGRQMLALN